MERTFTKIKRKFAGPGIELAWSEPTEDPEQPERNGKAMPYPASGDFNHAFDVLKCHVTEPCGMTIEEAAAIRVLGVKMSRGANGTVKGSILAARRLEGYTPKPENMPLQKFEGVLLKDVQDLEAQADAYLEGEHGQLKMDEDARDDEDEQGDLLDN